MAINNTTTLRRTVQQYKEWADAHPMVNQFGYGDFLELYSESEAVYPYIMVNCTNYSEDTWYIKLQIEVFVAMWVFDERNNQLPSESTSLEILRHLNNTVRYSDRWQQFSKLNSENTGFKVIERGADKITGWGTTHNLWIKRKSGICDLLTLMPEYDFETQATSGCSPVTLFINDVEEESIPAGTQFNLTVVDTNGDEQGTYNETTNTITVPAAGGGGAQTYNIIVDGVNIGTLLMDGTNHNITW